VSASAGLSMDEIRAALREELRAAASKPAKEFYSLREVGRIFGVDPAVKVKSWVQDGRLRTVEIDGRVCVPRAEIDRIGREGIPKAGARVRKGGGRRAAAKAKTIGEQLHELENFKLR
jgi:hypothetical protein